MKILEKNVPALLTYKCFCNQFNGMLGESLLLNRLPFFQYPFVVKIPVKKPKMKKIIKKKKKGLKDLIKQSIAIIEINDVDKFKGRRGRLWYGVEMTFLLHKKIKFPAKLCYFHKPSYEEVKINSAQELKKLIDKYGEWCVKLPPELQHEKQLTYSELKKLERMLKFPLVVIVREGYKYKHKIRVDNHKEFSKIKNSDRYVITRIKQDNKELRSIKWGLFDKRSYEEFMGIKREEKSDKTPKKEVQEKQSKRGLLNTIRELLKKISANKKTP